MNRRKLLSLLGWLPVGIVGRCSLTADSLLPSSSIDASAELQKQLRLLASRLSHSASRISRQSPEFHLYSVVSTRCRSSSPVSPALIQAACDLSDRLTRSVTPADRSDRLLAERFCRVARQYIATRV